MNFFHFVQKKSDDSTTGVFLNLEDLSYLTIDRNVHKDVEILSVGFKDGAIVDYENIVDLDYQRLWEKLIIKGK